MDNQEKHGDAAYGEVYETYREIYNRQDNPIDKDNLVKDVFSFGEPSLYRLEKFVESVVHSDALLYASFLDVDFYLQSYSEKYCYSERVQLFYDVCKEMGIKQFIDPIQPSTIVRKPTVSGESEYFTQAEIYDEMVSNIRVCAASEEFLAQVKKREMAVNKDFRSAKKYVDSCFTQFDKLFVLRIDLCSLNQSLGQRGDLEILREYFLALADEFNSNKMPNGVVGYLAKLEYGKSKGYFVHLVLLLDGNTLPREDFWIGQIRETWARITSNSGLCLNCNHEYEGFLLEKGVRSIERNQTDKRAAFERWVLGYLTKSLQYLAPKINKGDKIFFMGKPFEGGEKKTDLTKKLLSVVKTDRAKDRLSEAEAIYSETLFLRSKGSISYVDRSNPYTKMYLFVLLQVERFVIALQHDARDAFDICRDEDNNFTYTVNPLGSFLLEFGDLTDTKNAIEKTNLDFKIEFSVYVGVFCAAVGDLLEYIESRKGWRDTRRASLQERKKEDKVHYANKFVNFVRVRLVDSATRKSFNTRNSRASAKFKEACTYIDSLFSKYGDLYVLSLDLYPSNVIGNLPPTRTKLGSYPQLLGKFFSNGKNNKCLSAMAGFMGKWEYTSERGIYARVMILIDATKVSNEKQDQLIELIGRYWTDEITKGKGRYERSAITQDASFTNETFFQVHRKNTKLRRVLKNRAVGYLTKSDLFVKEKGQPMKNVFFRGELSVKKTPSKSNKSVIANLTK